MNNWIDFRELRESLSFAEVLLRYKVELRLRGDQHHGFCPLPLHKGRRNSPSFSANLRKGIWQCFGCGGKGNTLDFAVLMEGANPENGEDVRRIASELKERFLGSSGSRMPAMQAKETNDQNVILNAPLDFELKGLDESHPYLRSRGFSPETIAQFGLGYCSRGRLKDRIAIPLHDNAGRLIGYAGRVADDSTISEENPKYRFPGGRKRKEFAYEFRKSLFLYNAHRLEAPVDDLIIVEGFTGLWWLSQAGLANTVATMGAACSKEQAETVVTLVSPVGRVWIMTDGDAAGIRCAESILAQVAPFRFVRWVQLQEDVQPTSFAVSELRKCFTF